MATVTTQAKANIFIDPRDYIYPNRNGVIKFGFGDEYIDKFTGKSRYPEIKVGLNQANLHFFDELDYLSEYKLSGGSLQIDIRVDRYIWGILDEVYTDYFYKLASFDSDETWTGGTTEDINHRGGDQALKLESISASTDSATMAYSSSIDLSDYNDEDYISCFLYLEDSDLLDTVHIRLGDTALSNYYQLELDDTDLVNGWNEIYVNISELTEVGSPDWTTIEKAYVSVTAITSNDVYIIIDELRVTDSYRYPRRIFDVGLQDIPVAWWAGNTALYEIKIACESEGSRFYSDEMGILRFENRQHYNINDEHKNSKYLFNFNVVTDLDYISSANDIINEVVTKLSPRIVTSEKEIWRYGFVPRITPSETRTIWAEFVDPVPTTATGLVTPVSTTDYTANTQEDGGGTDKTANISVSVTKFATSCKIEVTNNDASSVYLTLLKLRGTPAEESDESRVIAEDATSIENYGVRPSGGYIIQNKYMADETYAYTLSNQLVNWYGNPIRHIELKGRSVPQLQIGDMITVNNEYTGEQLLMRIVRIKDQFSENGLNQEITSRSVTPFETLSYFTIGTSSIEGDDVISS